MQIRAWKVWEKEAAGQDYEFSNGTLHTPYSILGCSADGICIYII